MAEPIARPYATPDEYLRFEREAPERHELIDGEIVAMSGGTFEHALIAGNATTALGNTLRGRACFVCSPDMRIKVEALERYTYPDVSVVCGTPAFEDDRRDTLLNPVALFEVLSDSTESDDRGEKFAGHRTLSSLVDYVLISQKSVLVEHYTRHDDGSWLLRAHGPGERIRLPGLGCELAVDEIYLKVFAPADSAQPS